MENKKSIRYLNSRKWYEILKILNIIFVVLCYVIAIVSCITLVLDGNDGIGFLLKIIFMAVLLFLFWIISKTPQHIFYFLWGAEKANNWRSKIILVVGSLSLLFIGIVFATMILPFNNGDKQFVTTNASPAGSPEFVQTLADLTGAPVQKGDAVIPLNDASQFLPTLLNSINTASFSVNFTTFPWSDGTFSDEVFAALTAAAARGVQVRLLLDGLGAHTVSKEKIQTLQSAGGIVAEYHPFKLLNPLQYDNRDHMRAVIIDGKIGFTGGIGITDDWLGDSSSTAFQDMMFEFHGTMAQSIQNTFDENWNNVTGRVLSGPMFYPAVATSTAQNTFVGITSIPSEDYQPVRDSFMLTILSAQKTLWIVNPYIIPDKNLLQALEDKAKAGVDVRILSPGKNTDAPVLQAAWHSDYEPLLESGVKLYEYQPTMIHTKFMVADGVWSLVGSANIDNRSELLNNENVMGISDPVLADSLDQTFTNYLSQSDEITLMDWKNQYGFFQKLYSHMLLVLFKQY